MIELRSSEEVTGGCERGMKREQVMKMVKLKEAENGVGLRPRHRRTVDLC